MTLKAAVSLAFVTALAFVAIKSIYNPDSATIGMTILCYGWVSTQIVAEGFVAIIWLFFKRLIEKTIEQDSDENE